MSVTSDILATYRGPGRVVRRLLDMGQREDRALAILMASCVVLFIAQLPRLSREAHLEGRDLNELMAGSLMALILIAPLLMYVIAAASHVVAKVVGGKGDWFGARLALFWALLASSPLVLLHGLVAGFIGPGPSLQLVGAVWFAVFAWFWIAGLFQAERPQERTGA
ncbi:Yip1 domain protein [Falsiruegeria litorea R37]|uniref:Yip1 domain protein n=1 Tax=Falsiruegeria litorea R37 TaxID=1200284 RepID=A0A1Y5SMQ5_9RHOB|nr:YIP1 family protein [Falsiruegeria litorea]SLN42585.1 Yip1 domain protein [Falsiruegeria litorea R37]